MYDPDYMVGKQILQDRALIFCAGGTIAREIENRREDGSWKKMPERERLELLVRMIVLCDLERRIDTALDTFDQYDYDLLDLLALDEDEDVAIIPKELEREYGEALCEFTRRL